MRFALPIAILCTLLCAIQPPVVAGPGTRDRPVDRAIDRALAFLARTQDPATGAWKANGAANPAITSLAVMAFLSSGNVPGEGRYGEIIEKGVRYVLTMQKGNGLIASEQGHEMYHHGICTLMLAEVSGMTEGALARQIREAVTRAVAVILQAQRVSGRDAGGWRYRVQHVDGSDISVTGWQIMALRAARNIGCDVPGENIERAVDYIKRCQDTNTGGFKYQPGAGVTIPCTGTSILALELCGKNLHHSPEVMRAGQFLLRNFPNADQWPRGGYFFYMVYYCTQAFFQLGDGYWNVFRDQLHKVLLQRQKSGDPSHPLDGSWADDGPYGPAYATAMAVLALTVEYRFLPIYQRSEEPPGKE